MHVEEKKNRGVEVESIIGALSLKIDSKCRAHKRYSTERKWQSLKRELLSVRETDNDDENGTR